jgi:hypothetical protein
MTKFDREGFVRLGVGLALNLCLWPLVSGLAKWSSYDRETRLAFVSGSLAAAAVVSVIPLFWRGKPWQAPLAFVLLWLPGLTLYAVICTVLHQL